MPKYQLKIIPNRFSALLRRDRRPPAPLATAPAKKRARKKARKLPAAVRAQISAALKGRKLSAAHRARISAAHRGKVLSRAHRAKLSAAHRGVSPTPATRAKISAGQKGRKKSAAHRAKISAALKGHPTPASTRTKISAALQGRKLSAAHRARISQALRAHPPNLRHGLYAAPSQSLRTPDDLYRWRGETQARLSALLDQLPTDTAAGLNHWANLLALYARNASKLARHLHGQKAAQADTQAAEKLMADLLREMEEELKQQEGEEKK